MIQGRDKGNTMTTPQTAQTHQEPDGIRMHPAMRLGHVHYTAASLERQIAFYRDVLGFAVHWRAGGAAGLGAGGQDLLRLTEVPQARRAQRTTGLYHTAFLVPNRWELAHLLRQIIVTNTRIQGMVDHHTHLAIYLPDAEGNGIELAWDYPREQWPDMQRIFEMGNAPLDAQELLAEIQRDARPWQALDSRTQVGHVHLHVNSLEAAAAFYRETLGLDQIFMYPHFGAAFFSAGGYHHHVGTNIWNGTSAPRPPQDAIGLRYYSIILPDGAEVARLRAHAEARGAAVQDAEGGALLHDPAGNGILLTAAG